MVGTAV